MNTRRTLNIHFDPKPLRPPVQITRPNPPQQSTNEQTFVAYATENRPFRRSGFLAGYMEHITAKRFLREPSAHSTRPNFVAYATKFGRFLALALCLGFALPSLADSLTLPPLWRWSNPAPHGANIVDQATVGPLTVQVGERGQIFLSDDWRVWIPRDSGTMLAFRGATFFNGRLVITGESGAVMVADNPWDFYGLMLGTADWLESVAASDTRVVAVGDNAAIYTSTNAINWQRATPGFANWLRSVAYGTNTFVAVGEGGLIATSQDGMSWQVRTSGTTVNLNRVAWLGDHFLAVGDGGKTLTSPTGVTWSSVMTGATNTLFAAAGVTNSHLIAGSYEARLVENGGAWSDQLSTALAAPVPSWTYYSGLWNSNYYLLAGQTGLSVEGGRTNESAALEWQPLAESVRTWLWNVTRTPSHYVSVGDHGTILTSPNGIDWDFELIPDSATNSVLLGVGGSTNLFLAVGNQGTILWATNVFLWNALSPAPTANDLQGVCHDGSRFILSGGNGTILTSHTGTNWTSRSTPTTSFLMSVANFPGGLVAVGEHGTILTSGDGGTNWTAQISGTTNWLMQVRWLNDRLLAVGASGTLLTSFDGAQWSTNATGTSAWLNAADYTDGAWFVVGNQGTVLGSQDTTNWMSFGTITRKSLYGVTIHSGQLVTVGTEGVVIRRQLVPDPTPIQIASYSRSSGYDVLLFTGGVDQQFRLQSSTNLLDWEDGARLEFLDGTGTVLYVQENGGETTQTFYRTLRTR
jgi:hypothetical protein